MFVRLYEMLSKAMLECSRVVEAVEYFLLPLPAPYKVIASEFASASSLFLQSASAFRKI